MTGLIPNPEDGNSASRGSAKRKKKSRSRGPHRTAGQHKTLTAEQCLMLLQQLAGIVALGLISTPQANVLRSIYQAMLSYHQRLQATPGRQALGGAEMLAKLRADPDLVNMLAGFLTQDQLDQLFEDDGSEEDREDGDHSR